MMKSVLFAIGLMSAFASAQVQAAGASALDDERVARKADIAFYTTGFDGGDAKMTCVRPAIPPTSKTNEEIAKVDKDVKEWFDCYNGFVQRLNEAQPAGKRIPADLARIMRPNELAQAREHMNQVYATIGDLAEGTATALVAQHKAWQESTVLFATTKNAETKAKIAADIVAYDLMMQRQLEMKAGTSGGKTMAPSSGK
jgi:hypothetical protein